MTAYHSLSALPACAGATSSHTPRAVMVVATATDNARNQSNGRMAPLRYRARSRRLQHAEQQYSTVDDDVFVMVNAVSDGHVAAIASFVDRNRPPLEANLTLGSGSDLGEYDRLLSQQQQSRAFDREFLARIHGNIGGSEHLRA